MKGRVETIKRKIDRRIERREERSTEIVRRRGVTVRRVGKDTVRKGERVMGRDCEVECR